MLGALYVSYCRWSGRPFIDIFPFLFCACIQATELITKENPQRKGCKYCAVSLSVFFLLPIRGFILITVLQTGKLTRLVSTNEIQSLLQRNFQKNSNYSRDQGNIVKKTPERIQENSGCWLLGYFSKRWTRRRGRNQCKTKQKSSITFTGSTSLPYRILMSQSPDISNWISCNFFFNLPLQLMSSIYLGPVSFSML